MTSADGERLRLGLALRVIGLLVFPLAVILAALLQRGLAIVACLAVGMMLVGYVERVKLARSAGGFTLPQLPELLAGFVWRGFALLVLYMVSTGIFAVFRGSHVAREFGVADLLIMIGAIAVAGLANLIGGRMASSGLMAAFSAVRSSFSRSDAADYVFEGEIIEGEVSDPANDNGA